MVAKYIVLLGLEMALLTAGINAMTFKKNIQVKRKTEIVESNSTTEFPTSSLITCTILCLARRTDCCALSYSNQICRFEPSCQYTTQSKGNSVVVRPCAPGWTLEGTKCYLFINRKPWIKSKTYCANLGASLAEPDTPEQILFLKQTAQSLGLSHGYWLGATDLAVEGEFRWNSSGKHVTLTDWYDTEPNNLNGEEHCICIKSTTYRWYDVPCTNRFRLICQRDSNL